MKRFYGFLVIAGLLITVLAAVPQSSPGYMDADFYYAGAKRLASGQGASEPYLWNYLGDPEELPAPSFTYWMPLTSLVAGLGVWVLPWAGWWGARLPLILLAGLIAPLTAALGLRITRSERQARQAGLLALLPGFYLAYFPTTDVFVLEMVLGGLFLLLAGIILRPAPTEHERSSPSYIKFLLLGSLAGLMHLARADGILWLGGCMLVVVLAYRTGRSKKIIDLGLLAGVAGAGYLLVMGPWFARNLGEWGSFFPPGGARTVWLSEYEQTMLFPAGRLTPDSWLSAGWLVHLRARLNALSAVFQTMLAVQSLVVLLPFALAGMWLMRSRPEVKVAVALWGLLAGLMVFMFPFASVNGSYFHSAAALQPLVWAVTPAGIDALMLRYARWRKIARPHEMVRFTTGLLIVTCLVLTIYLYYQRVIGDDPGSASWNASSHHYIEVDAELLRQGAQPGERALVNNPPGYWLASNRPALVIPYGGTDMLLAAADRYQARYVILERTNPWQLADLYYDRETPPQLEYLSSVGETRLYRVISGKK